MERIKKMRERKLKELEKQKKELSDKFKNLINKLEYNFTKDDNKNYILEATKNSISEILNSQIINKNIKKNPKKFFLKLPNNNFKIYFNIIN